MSREQRVEGARGSARTGNVGAATFARGEFVGGMNVVAARVPNLLSTVRNGALRRRGSLSGMSMTCWQSFLRGELQTNGISWTKEDLIRGRRKAQVLAVE